MLEDNDIIQIGAQGSEDVGGTGMRCSSTRTSGSVRGTHVLIEWTLPPKGVSWSRSGAGRSGGRPRGQRSREIGIEGTPSPG